MINRKYILRNKKVKKIRKFYLFLLSFIIVTVLFCFYFDFFLISAINSSVEYNAKSIVTESIYQNILQVLEDDTIDYSKLVSIGKNESEEITSVEIDSKTINTLQTKITLKINSALKEITSTEYAFSLGTLTKNPILAGRGPDVKLKIEPHGYISPTISSKFESVGINQTLHKIILNVNVYFTTVIPFNKCDHVLSSDFLINETIIVGEIPQYYANISAEDGISNYKNPNIFPNIIYKDE